MQVEADRRYTLGDLWDFPDDGQRRELIDGVLYVTPMARTRHQAVVGWLTYRFAQWVEVNGGVILPGCNVDLDDGTHLEPDVAFVRPGRGVGDVLALHKPPDVVVEVSSPSTKRYDLGIKRDRYAREGATEFWFVDLDTDTIMVSILAGDRYRDPAVLARGERITTPLAPGLEIDVTDILNR